MFKTRTLDYKMDIYDNKYNFEHVYEDQRRYLLVFVHSCKNTLREFTGSHIIDSRLFCRGLVQFVFLGSFLATTFVATFRLFPTSRNVLKVKGRVKTFQ